MEPRDSLTVYMCGIERLRDGERAEYSWWVAGEDDILNPHKLEPCQIGRNVRFR